MTGGKTVDALRDMQNGNDLFHLSGCQSGEHHIHHSVISCRLLRVILYSKWQWSCNGKKDEFHC